MDCAQVDVIRSTRRLLAGRTGPLVDRFHARLFEREPAMRPLFPPEPAGLARQLRAALDVVTRNVHRLDEISGALHEIGARHARYGATREFYRVFGEELVAAMQDVLGARWPEGADEAWLTAMDRITRMMLEGAAAREQPAA